MSLADQVRNLELLREQGGLAEPEFERQIAELLRSVTAASEETIVDATGKAIGDEIQGGPPPAHLGAYELMELLGEGGMGAVYLAKHLLKPGLFAVKVPRKDFLRRQGFGHHFKKEAGVGLRLDHPGIVRVLDLIIDGEWAAIVMQFVAGPNLEEVLQRSRGRLNPTRVVELMRQVLEAMDYAHSAGVLHRDLKPKNLLLHPSGQVKVTDFGVAGLIGIEDTEIGAILGTAPYMAPELYTGAARIDRRTDIYALGMTLYKLLVGRLPFGREMTPYQVLHAKEAGQVPRPADLGVHVPPHLVEVIFRALQPAPRERFPSCGSFRAALLGGSPHSGVGVAFVPSRSQAVRLVAPTPRDPRLPPNQTSVAASMTDTLSSLPVLEAQTRMSAGTLMTLLLVTALLAAVIALALSGDLRGVLETPAPSESHQVQLGSAPQIYPWSERPSPTEPPSPTDPPTEPSEKNFQDEDGLGNNSLTSPSQPAQTRRQRQPTSSERRARRRAERRAQRRQEDASKRQEDASKRHELTANDRAESTGMPLVGDAPARAELGPPPGTTGVSSSMTKEVAPSPPKVTQPEGPAMGFLHLSARPECEVSIDGKSYGTTAKTSSGLILREGAYKVRFVCADDALCGSFAKRAGVKTLQVYGDQATRYHADFFKLNH